MVLAIREERISVADYLAGEEKSEERHEYADGVIYATAGATEQHEILGLSLASALLRYLRGKGCRVFKGDMKVRLTMQAGELFDYPDAHGRLRSHGQESALQKPAEGHCRGDERFQGRSR